VNLCPPQLSARTGKRLPSLETVRAPDAWRPYKPVQPDAIDVAARAPHPLLIELVEACDPHGTRAPFANKTVFSRDFASGS